MSKYKNEQIPYEKSFAYHIEIELGLNLDDIWNWEKNNELGINPYEISYGSHKKVWLYCLEHDYHNYDREGNKVGYEISCNDFYNKKSINCGYCYNHKTHYKDSLAYKYPQIAEMIAIKENDLTFEDCYNIACHSGKKFHFKCNECGLISDNKKILGDIIRRGYSCSYCSDNITIPNKYLRQLKLQGIIPNLEFEVNIGNYRLDALDKENKIILEMDGSYGNHNKEYHEARDKYFYNNFQWKTIRINLTDNNQYNNNKKQYIENAMILSLSEIYDLTSFNWELAWKESQRSLKLKALRLCHEGYLRQDIARILDIDKTTVYRWLQSEGIETQYEIRIQNKEQTKILIQEGKDKRTIAKILNVDVNTIHTYVRELINEGELDTFVTKSQRAMENKQKIKLLWLEGKGIKEISDLLCLHESTVTRNLKKLRDENEIDNYTTKEATKRGYDYRDKKVA